MQDQRAARERAVTARLHGSHLNDGGVAGACSSSVYTIEVIAPATLLPWQPCARNDASLLEHRSVRGGENGR